MFGFASIKRISGRNSAASVAFLTAALLFASAVFAVAQQDGDANQAIELFQRGQDAHERGDLKAAIESYEKALKLFPDFPEAEVQRGNALVSLGRYAEAERSFRRAAELKPDWPPALAGLGFVLVEMGKYSEAEKPLLKAVKAETPELSAYASLTELRLRSERSPDALRQLLADIRALGPRAEADASILSARAALETALGEREAARASVAKALQRDPNNRYALAESVNAALADNDLKSAEVSLVRLETVAPQAENVSVLKAKLQFAQGKFGEGLKTLRAIPTPSGETLKLLRSVEVSVTTDPKILEAALVTEPGNAAVLGRLCSLMRTSDPKKALEYCRRASEAEPNNISHAIGFGAALVQAHRYAEAITLLRKLAEASPENTAIRANMAAALFQSKQYAEAKAQYAWLIGRQPEVAVAYYFLAITHDLLGEYTEAMANYELFLRRADPATNQLEIEKVKLRLPTLQRQLKEGKGKRND